MVQKHDLSSLVFFTIYMLEFQINFLFTWIVKVKLLAWPKLVSHYSFKPKIITKLNDAKLWLQKAIPNKTFNWWATENGSVG